MKFEREKLSTRFIERRVREEQAKDTSGRRIVRVVLTPAEWSEFMMENPELRYYQPMGPGNLPQAWKIRIAQPISPLASSEQCIGPDDYIWTVDVVREERCQHRRTTLGYNCADCGEHRGAMRS